MYIFVTVQEKEHYYRDGPWGLVKARLEEASGQRCLIVPYQEFNLKVVKELQPKAIAMSGFGGHFQDRQIAWFYGMDEVLQQVDVPMIGFCGSHQVIGFAFNNNLRKMKKLYDQPMRKMSDSEDCPRLACADKKYDLSAYFVAEGFYPIKRVKNDPLFEELPARMLMRCSHYCEVKRLPPGFELLACSAHCQIEAMRHHARPLYGTQFHPEAYKEPFFHGRTLLRNFARIVENFWTSIKKDKKRS